VVCEGLFPSTPCGATVSPEVGIEGLVEHSHLPAVIRKAGLEWAARREDGQGAIHSPFWSITRRPRIPARPVSPVRAHVLLPWTASGEHYPTAPDAVAPFAAVELPLELSAAQPRAPTVR